MPLLRVPIYTLLLAALTATAHANEPAPAPPPANPWVALIVGIAWPLAACVMALAFRKPLAAFLNGLSGRITKLSAFKVELELATEPAVATSPLLDDIRSATTAALISDSSRMMLEQAQSNLPADFSVINIGTGEEWLTTRLFIASAMLERMRGVRAIVFVEDTPSTKHRFVAIAALPQLRWALARQFPWLDAAWARAYVESVYPSLYGGVLPNNNAAWMPDPRTLLLTPGPIESANGALSAQVARSLVARFIGLVQSDPAPGPPAVPPPKTFDPAVLLQSQYSQAWERADWVTCNLLEALLPAEAFELWANEHRDEPRMRLTRSVLRRSGPFVALVRGDREYVRLVNRSVLLEEAAASLGEEHETK